MTWLSKGARDIPPKHNKHICHKKRDLGFIYCLICDNGNCKSEFVRRVNEGHGFFVTRHLVICPAHSSITYDIINRSDTENITEYDILKYKVLLLQKQMENIENGLDTTLESDRDCEQMEIPDDDDSHSIASEKAKKRKVEYDEESDCVNCTIISKDLKHEKSMNCELK